MKKLTEILKEDVQTLTEAASRKSLGEVIDKKISQLEDIINAINGDNGSADEPHPNAKKLTMLTKSVIKNFKAMKKLAGFDRHSQLWFRQN